jgi:hypothetical protein
MAPSLASRLALGFLLAAPAAQAQEVPYRAAYLSFQGSTGLFNVPNALVTAEGTADLLYTNQVDSRWSGRVPWSDTYLASFGLIPFAEGGIRLTEARGAARDLSANLKFQIPFLPDWAPRIAVGVQDYGGAAPYFRSRYGVLSQDLGPLRLTLGHGRGPDRLKGTFGGVELQVLDWLHLLGEHNTVDRNLGLRLLTPRGWLPGEARLGALVKQTLGSSRRHTDLGFTLKVPLGIRSPRVSDPGSFRGSRPGRPVERIEPPAGPLPFTSPRLAPDLTTPDVRGFLGTLERTLVDQGLENVRVGTQGTVLVVTYENHRFNHNELDALGLVMGTALASPPASFTAFRVQVLRQQLQVLRVEGPTAPFKAFFAESGSTGLLDCRQLGSLLRVSGDPAATDVAWLGPARNGSPLRVRLALYPGLDTAVGTEVGVFDYRLSLLPDLRVDLWKGATLNARWDVPVSWSENYRWEGMFGGKGTRTRLDRVMLQQALPLAPGLVTQFGAGQYEPQVRGWMNETRWAPGSGQHELHLSAGQFRPRSGDLTKVLVGTYRYYLPRLDAVLEATYGSFYNRDHGYRLELRRFFGDTALSVFYARTTYQIAGFSLSVPLTPRRDMRAGLVQVTGADRWSYGLYSVIRNPVGTNPVVSGLAKTLTTPQGLDQAYANSDRLSAAYLLEHLPRLREAYLRWR